MHISQVHIIEQGIGIETEAEKLGPPPSFYNRVSTLSKKDGSF